MIFISEDISARLVDHEMAYVAVRNALIAASEPNSVSFPVVLGHAGDPGNRFTIKPSTDHSLTGLKVGSYFPSNDAAGLPRHSSITLLFDQDKGRIGAIIEGSKLNAFRTAAANAVATDALARPDAKVIAVIGTGHQAAFEVFAVARIRPPDQVLVVGRNPHKTAAFVSNLIESGLPAVAVEAQVACAAADIIITATTSTEPLFSAEWVQAGCHISSKESDRTGKQELPPELFGRAKLYCDLPQQSAAIGEFQHASGRNLVAIGDVLAGRATARTSADDITIFDSSGISLQDLYMAQAVIKADFASRTQL